MSKALDKQINDLIKDRQNAESDLDLAVALIDWITDIPMSEDERRYKFTSWAAFNDSQTGNKYCWKFLKDCGLVGVNRKMAKIEYEFYKERWCHQ